MRMKKKNDKKTCIIYVYTYENESRIIYKNDYGFVEFKWTIAVKQDYKIINIISRAKIVSYFIYIYIFV